MFPLNKILNSLPAYPGRGTTLQPQSIVKMWSQHSIMVSTKKTLPCTQYLAWFPLSCSLRRLGGYESLLHLKRIYRSLGPDIDDIFRLDQKVEHSSSFWHKKEASEGWLRYKYYIFPDTWRMLGSVLTWPIERKDTMCPASFSIYSFWNHRLLQAVMLGFLSVCGFLRC